MADKFLRGAMILTMAGLMVKILGSVNRILLSRLLGGEGIGLYQMAYPVFLLMLSVSSAGIPIAISIIVSEKVAKGQFKAAEQVFKISLGLMVVTGLCFALALFFGAGWLDAEAFCQTFYRLPFINARFHKFQIIIFGTCYVYTPFKLFFHIFPCCFKIFGCRH